jgi:hypothetical protein
MVKGIAYALRSFLIFVVIFITTEAKISASPIAKMAITPVCITAGGNGDVAVGRHAAYQTSAIIAISKISPAISGFVDVFIVNPS